MKYKSNKDGLEIIKKDYRKKIIFQPEDFKETGHLLQTVTIPSQTKQRKHSHNRQTEVFYILEGQAKVTINDKDYLANPGDSFICTPGDVHNLWNKTDKDFKLIVFKINMPKDYEDTNWQE